MSNHNQGEATRFSKKNPHHVRWCEAMRVGWLESFSGIATLPYDKEGNEFTQRGYECGRIAAAYAKVAGVRPKWGHGVILPEAIKSFAYRAMREIDQMGRKP